MGNSIWDRFLALFEKTPGGADEDEYCKTDGEEDGDATERSGFVPSPLDRSVRVGHGGSDDEIERELSKVDEHARNLESEQRDG